MEFSLLKKEVDEDGTEAISVKNRLRAWWNGDVLEAEPLSNAAKSRVTDEGDEAGDHADSSQDDGEQLWSESRRQLAQELWSHGFVVPGGTDYIEKLVSGCSLTAAETMLEVGIGMGGGSRTIIGKFGNYVTGYDRDPDLVAAALRHAVTYDIDDKLQVTAQPFEELQLKSSYFRAALLRDVLYTMEDKEGLITKIGESLKTGEAFLVMTDFLFDPDADSEELAAWKAVEERPVYPWTEAALTKALDGAGIQPRIIEDESEDYCAMVIDTWSDYMKTIDGADVTPALGRAMEREGEFWARRVAALKSGALRYYRIEAVKNS